MDAGEILAASKIVPVVTVSQADQAVALAECLLNAGMSAIEITLRSDVAIAAIEN
ncbi:MAG: keto-deoxy-phosphogluconate aldolase, partial [Gammaproteobacteria bacterium]|nr:keto-deoxy-phosphogluconate aldolase [Gammaproteobacteria bacterium]